MGHRDLRLGKIVYISVFCNISLFWLLPLDGFQCIFLCRVYCVTVKMIFMMVTPRTCCFTREYRGPVETRLEKMASILKELPNRRKTNCLWSILSSVMAPILHWFYLQKSLIFVVKRQRLRECFLQRKTFILHDQHRVF